MKLATNSPNEMPVRLPYGEDHRHSNFEHARSLPSPADLLDDKVSWQCGYENAAIIMAVLSDCAQFIRFYAGSRKDKERRAARLWKAISNLPLPVLILGIPAARLLAQNQLILWEDTNCLKVLLSVKELVQLGIDIRPNSPDPYSWKWIGG